MKAEPVTGIILSGGKCLRMGMDKAFCMFLDREMISYAIRLLDSFADEILISANESHYESLGFRVISDRYRDAGPMAGLHASVSEASNEDIVVISCDMPLAHPAIVGALFSVPGDHDAVIPTHDGWKEPLLARYRKRILPVLTECLDSGIYKLMSLLERIDTHYLDVSELSSGLPANPFANINTPADLAYYEGLGFER